MRYDLVSIKRIVGVNIILIIIIIYIRGKISYYYKEKKRDNTINCLLVVKLKSNNLVTINK